MLMLGEGRSSEEELVLPGESDFFSGVSFWWCSVLPTMHGEKLCSLTGRLPQLYWGSGVHYNISLNGVWIIVQLFIHHGPPLMSFYQKWHVLKLMPALNVAWRTWSNGEGCTTSVRGKCEVVLIRQWVIVLVTVIIMRCFEQDYLGLK